MKRWTIHGVALVVAAAVALSAGFGTRAGAADPGDIAAKIKHGADLFAANGCGWCHEGAGRKAARGPQLMNSARDDAFIMNRVEHGSPGRMPAFGASLPPADIQDIIAYIRNLKPETN
jgi:mono/diheme cytochrome c family protein